MEKAYEPKKYEKKIYDLWQRSGHFNPNKLPGKRKKTYTIAIPPPNITGSLHMGHTLNATIQDILIRFYRMNGYQTLWLVGTDHAGIATQNVVEKTFKKEGLKRQDLGQEKFVQRIWQWVDQYGQIIIEQLKKIGCSCDWSRQRFTLDDNYVKAVYQAFIHYWQKGLIYRGPRLVNWCPRCETAISDIEVKYQRNKGKLYYIKYPLKISNFKIQNSITVATTRPETMLGDTAVAVNPKDERYKNLIGQKVILPLVNREIPVIAHHLVEQKFGTGVVKITPAHDATDWKIGKEMNLETINVVGPDGKMTAEVGRFAGLSIEEARTKILEELKNQGLLEKEEDYTYNLSLCDRCESTIEPQVSVQWFLKMKELASPAIEIVKKGKIKIIPARYKKIYLDWLVKVEDWCISRQLWWGHQLPVWYCQTGRISNFQFPISKKIPNLKSQTQNSKDNFIISLRRPKQCPFCKRCQMEQSADVLDTWFSSALWPFAILGWPIACAQNQKSSRQGGIKNQNYCKPLRGSDLDKFYPTDFLTTAQEILYLWVARMIFSSIEFTKKIPFKDVYIHPTVLAFSGKRMSKSLGTGVDPLEIAEKYGADAVRMGLIYQTNRDQQSFHFDERAILATRNFINKLWNISRFVAIARNQIRNPKSEILNKSNSAKAGLNFKTLTLADRRILSRLNTIIESTTEKIKNYQLGEAAREIYDFVWHEFADWYLEISKIQITDKKLQKNTLFIIHNSLFIILKLLHPFIPFVTETINIQLNNLTIKQYNKLLIVTDWPRANKKIIDKKTEKEFEKIKKLVVEIRNWRSTFAKNFSGQGQEKIPLQETPEYKLKKPDKIILKNQEIIEKLAKVKLLFN